MATPDTPPTGAATPTEGALDLARLLDEWDAEVEQHGIWTSGHHIAARMAERLRAAHQSPTEGALDLLEQEITRWDDQGGQPSREWFHGNCGEAMQWCAKRVRELLPHLRAAHGGARRRQMDRSGSGTAISQRDEAEKVRLNLKGDADEIAAYIVERCGDFVYDRERVAYIAEHLKAARGGRTEAAPVVKELLPTLFTAHPDGIFREISIDRVREWFTAPVLHADSSAACGGCGGPHPFDTSVPSVRWNAVIRSQELDEYLCLTCIVKAFAQCGESFTATLWGGEFNGLPIEVVINGKNATDAAAISDENTSLRAQLRWGRSATGEETP
jgi:hypothetical protein